MKNRNVIKQISCKDNNVNLYIDEMIKISCDYDLDNIYVCCNQFVNILKQETVFSNILSFFDFDNNCTIVNESINVSFATLYRCFFSNIMYVIYLNARKSEEGSRIQTTFNAKKNTKDNIDLLQLEINKIRKIKATTEILETTSTLEALKNNIIQ